MQVHVQILQFLQVDFVLRIKTSFPWVTCPLQSLWQMLLLLILETGTKNETVHSWQSSTHTPTLQAQALEGNNRTLRDTWLGMGIENRFLFRTGSQWTDSLESLAKFFNDSVIDSLCVCACANLLIQTAANMLAFWITSDWGEWDGWWNNSSWEALLSFLSNTTVLVFRSSVSLGASG